MSTTSRYRWQATASLVSLDLSARTVASSTAAAALAVIRMSRRLEGLRFGSHAVRTEPVARVHEDGVAAVARCFLFLHKLDEILFAIYL